MELWKGTGLRTGHLLGGGGGGGGAGGACGGFGAKQGEI